ncbi:hypothetical protein Pla52o_56040 [Novipirellula galeiformis]|uniref:Carboxypeptidase regulatory-like domain-containing protein n=1 Tax=Novipirellula galeiformis TaxID=2528004 RepID=A0A5C6BIK3_9BACT|nr:hypothetical protein [Novipirellula galeiformis]TWU11166.1 hypothetical protein Pla52o_56040 [Novipirellula galeiformis]
MFKTVSMCVLVCLTIGCGTENEIGRRPVNGTVTFDGKPLASGQIRFVPVPSGPVGVAAISQGKYEVTNKGGVPLGETKVEIVATNDAAPMTLEEMDANPNSKPPQALVIPPKYNQASELRATIESGSGMQTADFELTK